MGVILTAIMGSDKIDRSSERDERPMPERNTTLSEVGENAMPANRSRTLRWRSCLEQLRARRGALEIAIDTNRDPNATESGKSLIWRVRLVDVSDEAIVVESPRAFGQSISFDPGAALVVAMTIGQNRWMFRTEVIDPDPRIPDAIRLRSPEKVERCSRRSFYRVSTAQLNPAPVECWPLLDPASAVAAEVANRAMIQQAISEDNQCEGIDQDAFCVLPEVGPKFSAQLVNIGGGGAGLLISAADSSAIGRAPLLWMRIDLTPEIPIPLGLTARVVHTHLDSAQNLYAGMTFDFSYNTGHRDFIISQIARYTHLVQHTGKLKKAG